MSIPNPTFHGIFSSDPSNPRYDQARKEGYTIRDVKDLPPGLDSQITEERMKFLRVGDVVHRTWYREYRHGFTFEITKVNKKTVVGTEIKGSYRSGQVWKISFPKEFVDPTYRLSLEHMTTERILELHNLWKENGV